MQAFQEAAEVFREAAHNSRAADAVIARLLQADPRYATDDRNASVRQLARDVESDIGATAALLFRTPGALHDSLQTLMDAYEDAIDTISESKN